MEDRAYTASFATIYDDIMGGVPYTIWYDYLHDIMNYYQFEAKKVLELACGTANMSLLFARNAYQVSGLDISNEMLSIAAKKIESAGQSIDLIQGDLKDFNLKDKFDLVFCLFDSMNYILDINSLQKVFQNTYNVLKKDACFIFDMNTINRLMSIKEGTTVLNGDNYSCIWEDIVDKTNGLWKVKLKIYLYDKGDYFEEFHQERGYPIRDVIQSLKKVGFKQVDVYNAYTFKKAKEKDNRIYYVAFLEERKNYEKPVFLKTAKHMKWKVRKIFSSSI
ncbi:class I SAM-dependent DNA methyltransferase [Natronospora cellulosivora (SeqCode)]